MAADRNISVLIIDDNDMIREVLRVTLRSDGYNVVGEAADGASGLELVAKLKPDVLCLDILMPKISGLNVLKMVKTKLPRTAVLMITGQNDREVVQEALAAGASGFILKPFNTGTVLATMEKVAAKLRAGATNP
jgi:two-component system chemotaxis response regulator CheY